MKTILHYYEEDKNSYLIQFIRGHLYLEFALNKLIEKAFENPDDLTGVANSFYKKVKILKSIGKLSTQMESLLLEINITRNKIAHNLKYSLSFERTFELVNLAKDSMVDFSDDIIYSDIDLCRKYYVLEDMILELMTNTYYEIFLQNEELFPENEYLQYMT